MFGIGGLGLGAKVGLVMGALLLASIASFAIYFKISQARLEELNREIGIQETARASAEANLQAIRSQVDRQTTELGRLADQMAATRQAAERMNDIFAEHDLNALVSARPDLIETRVNNGTKAVLQQLEEITNPETYKIQPE